MIVKLIDNFYYYSNYCLYCLNHPEPTCIIHTWIALISNFFTSY